MKTILIFFMLFIFPVSLFALRNPLQNPFGKDIECPVKKVCFHAIKVSENVVIVFKGGCDKIEHVGIIYNKNRRILQLDDDLDIVSDQKLKNDEVFENTIEKTFPKSMWIDYKMYDEKDIDN